MTSSPLYNELDLLNLIIAMSFEHKSEGIDNLFYLEGYRIVSIDRSVNTDIGTIKYDIFLSNHQKNLSFGFELKGLKASNLDLNQLAKYENLPIKQYLSVGGAFYNDLETHRSQTIIGINQASEETVKNFIHLHGFNFPILTFDRPTESINIVYQSVSDEEICKKIRNLLYKQFGIPTFIFYDKESKWYHIAPRIINKIFQFAKMNHLKFSVNEIVEETYCAIPHLHKIIGFDVKKSVIDKIKKILKDMSNNELSNYLNWDGQNKKWVIYKINSNSHLNTDSAFLQLGKQYVSRIKQDITAQYTGFEQLSFFDDDEVLEKELTK